MKGWKQIFQANGQEKEAGVAIIISDKIDFQRRAIKRDPEGHFIILKRRIHEEHIKRWTDLLNKISTKILWR